MSIAPSDDLPSQGDLSALRAMLPPPKPMENRVGATQWTGGPRNGKRLSLNFPVQPNYHANSSKHTPSSSASGTPLSAGPPRLTERGPSPMLDSSSFLVDLAAQERRVLELKEELHRAEKDLEQLKRQWALHEASKKRDELRHVEQLQPLSTTLSSLENSGDEGVGLERMSTDQKLKLADAKRSRRKVMSGQTHTRTLSLLSPDRNVTVESFPQTTCLAEPDGHRVSNTNRTVPVKLAASNSMPEVSSKSAGNHLVDSRRDPPKDAPNDAILQTGRRMAEDFKDGLWTFIDDLRQATVGHDISSTGRRAGAPIAGFQSKRKQPTKGSPRNSAKPSPTRSVSDGGTSKSPLRLGRIANGADLVDIGATFWQEHGLDKARLDDTDGNPATSESQDSVQRQSLPTEDNGKWQAWDSPNVESDSPRWSSSTIVSGGGASPPMQKDGSQTNPT